VTLSVRPVFIGVNYQLPPAMTGLVVRVNGDSVQKSAKGRSMLGNLRCVLLGQQQAERSGG
jgi:hypothetical protein